MFSDTVKKFKRLTKHQERYLQPQNDVAEDIKNTLKDVYDFTKKQEGTGTNSSALPELFIQNFDDEQIWQELELQNSEKYTKFISDIPRLLAARSRMYLEFEGEGNESEVENEDFGNNNDQNDTKEESNEDNEIIKKKIKGKEKCKIKPSIVDDRFFKLSQLEDFLDKEDKKEFQNSKRKLINNHGDESEDSVDLFVDISSEENEAEEGGAHYDKFFDAPEDQDTQTINMKNRNVNEMDDDEEEDEDENDFLNDDSVLLSEEMTGAKNEKQVRFDLSPASSTDSDSENSDNNEKKRNTDADRTRFFMSNFEVRQQRLKERIKTLEERALEERSWQMKGEVSAASRPSNSLLEEVLEFDRASRPAPVMTEQTTMKLEDIIRQRVKDKSWDDVERKVKPTVAPDEYKKRLVMDHEKSKLSLAEIYEQDYLKQKKAQESDIVEKTKEELAEHRTIRAMTSALFSKLDALTNFHYTPKPVIPEVKIVSNLPAITMEEVVPVSASDATLLAPEEVKAKRKGELIGKDERTKTDKKRERRKKKQLQRIKQREKEKREKIVEKLRPGLGNKYSKERTMDTLKKLSNEKNVHQLDDKGKEKEIRSSSAFFNRLQEEAVGFIKRKSEDSKKKEKDTFSAKRLKL